MLAIDCETTGLDIRHGSRPFFVTTCNEGGEQEWWNWPVDPITRQPRIPKEDIDRIQHLILTSGDVIGQNIKFDIAALTSIGITEWPWNRIHDTLIAGHLLASNKPHNLTDMALQYLGVRIEPFEDALHEACEKARRECRRLFPHWQIAKQGAEGMPSVKGECWKSDMWLPRVLVNRLWEMSPLYKYINERDKDGLDTRHSMQHMQKLEGWTYLPPKFCKSANEAHPWWSVLEKYSNSDSSVTVMLWRRMKDLLVQKKLWNIYLERKKLVRIAFLLETKGITISGTRMEEILAEYREDSDRLGSICVDIARDYGVDLVLPRNGNNRSLMELCFGKPLNPDNPWRGPRVGGMGLPIVKRGKNSDAPSLDKSVLERYRTTLPRGSKPLAFILSMMDKRKCDTAISYLEGYRRFQVSMNGNGRKCTESEWHRLHPSMNPTGSDTIRWTSNNPNGQNLSKQEGFNLRYAFGPAPGREWWSMDAKNIELRIPAYEANEKDLIWIFEHPNDPPYYGSYHLVVFDTLHPALYKKHGKKCKDLFESTWYQWVKNGNFAVIYGCQRKKADQTYHVEGAYDKVRDRFPNIAKLADKQIAFANKYGYVETIPDRKVDPNRGYPLLCTRTDDGRILPTVPLNYHVSGTAMQWMNTSMISCQEVIDRWNQDGFDAFITLQVHDELTFDMPRGGDPKEDLKRVREWGQPPSATLIDSSATSNYWRALILQKTMMASGDRIGVPTPVSMKYAIGPWDEGESYAEIADTRRRNRHIAGCSTHSGF